MKYSEPNFPGFLLMSILVVAFTLLKSIFIVDRLFFRITQGFTRNGLK